MSGRRYTDDEVREILRRAVDHDAEDHSSLSHADLIDAAGEIGISADAVDAAAADLSVTDDVRAEVERRRARRRRRFGRHLVTYLLVNAFLFAIDFLTPGGPWFYYPLLGWGLLLALHGSGLLFTSEGDDREAAQKLVDRRRQREQRRRERQRRRDTSRKVHGEFERAVEEGVAALLAAAARKMDEARAAMVRAQGSTPASPDTELGHYIARRKGKVPPRAHAAPAGIRVDGSSPAGREEEEEELARATRRRKDPRAAS